MEQIYDNYTADDHKVWSILYNRQMDLLPSRASKAYLDGLEHSGFEPDRIPDFREVNQRLAGLTGWQVQAVPGIVDDDVFFKMLASKQFPATTWVRKIEQLDYLEEPDMFHDVFGHLPLLTNQPFCDFLQGMADIALKYINNKWAVELMSRIYWYTVEFGLIEENGENKIYGAGILSSNGESVYCLDDPIPQRKRYDVTQIFDSSYIKSKFQVMYYIINSYEQLYGSLGEVEEALEGRLKLG